MASSTDIVDAFSQTATAYANDSFLLLGVVGDQFVSGNLARESAAHIVTGVQKRVRIIRSNINLVLGMARTERNRKWLKMLDGLYVCLDQQAWSINKYVSDKTPANAKRFDDIRSGCLEKLNLLEQYQASLGSPEELPAPLSTR